MNLNILESLRFRTAKNRAIGRLPTSDVDTLASTTESQSTAQTLPEDVLLAIFQIVSDIDARETLAHCSLVCRSWAQPSSDILLRLVHVKIEPTQPKSRILSKASAIFKAKPQRRNSTAKCLTRRGQLFSDAALCTPRIVANLRVLHICTTTVDFMMLRSTVMRLVHLCALELRVDEFLPLSDEQWQPYLNSYRLNPPNRRPIKSLFLQRRAPTYRTTVITKPKSPAPQPLDVLLWFNHCHTLDIRLKGASARLIHLLSADSERKQDSDSHTQVSVRSLYLSLDDVGVCLRASFIEHMFHFHHLETLAVMIRPREQALLQYCLTTYGQKLQHLAIDLVSGIPSPYFNLQPDRQVADDINTLHSAIEDPIVITPYTSPNLRTAYLTLDVHLNSNSIILCQQLWQSYMKCLTSLPSLEDLFLTFFLTKEWYNIDAPLGGDAAETARDVTFDFLSGLDWSLLDREAQSITMRPDLPYPQPNCLTSFHLNAEEYDNDLGTWRTMSPEGQSDDYIDIVLSSMSARARSRLSISGTQFTRPISYADHVCV